MFYKEYDTGIKGAKVFVIEKEHISELEREIKAKIETICYGEEQRRGITDEKSYKRTCRELALRLNKWNATKPRVAYGTIAEMLMHLVVPRIFGNFSSISVLLASHDRDVKHGFDLNFFNSYTGEIWFGEVKSSTTKSRSSLIEKAKNGLLSFFSKVNENGTENTGNRWDAAIAEATAQASSGKIIKIKQLLTDSRNRLIETGEKQNAILMTMNYSNSTFPLDDFDDIFGKIKRYGEEKLFRKIIVISATKEVYDDIISFITEEGQG